MSLTNYWSTESSFSFFSVYYSYTSSFFLTRLLPLLSASVSSALRINSRLNLAPFYIDWDFGCFPCISLNFLLLISLLFGSNRVLIEPKAREQNGFGGVLRHAKPCVCISGYRRPLPQSLARYAWKSWRRLVLARSETLKTSFLGLTAFTNLSNSR